MCLESVTKDTEDHFSCFTILWLLLVQPVHENQLLMLINKSVMCDRLQYKYLGNNAIGLSIVELN